MTTQPEDKLVSQTEVTRIKSRIGSIIDEHFSRASGDLFLSQLGSKLGEDRQALEKLTGMKLSQFIRSNFAHEMGATGEHKNVLYLVGQGKSIEATAQTPTPRYLPRFWAAFAVPLIEAHERFIALETLRFGPDAPELKAGGHDVRRIDPKYIAPRNASGSAADTAGRITAWLEEQQLTKDRFLDTRKRPRETESLLDSLLKALDGDELKRVSLPLDIVKALSERRR